LPIEGFFGLCRQTIPVVRLGLQFDSVKEGRELIQYGTKSAAGVIMHDRADAMAATDVATKPTGDKPASHRL
jgi:hypothetical protein